MSNERNRKELNKVLRGLADELDVPPTKYQEAKDRYDAVGAWLGESGSELAPFKPVIYPQGSFALGTAVRPRGADDYDVDSVCVLQLVAGQITQQQVKGVVGDRLKHPGSRYKNMIDPKDGGRRCWTIKYADSSKFHLDVLPAIPDDFRFLIELGVPEAWAQHAICITDRETWNVDPNWPRSNPRGYAEWFKHRMRLRLQEAKGALALAKRAKVEDIEDFEVRTPLQRAIQLLKRHRDMRYNGDDDKPTSIILTTLAAQAYDNEADLADALLGIVPGMRNNILMLNGTWWVPNPVNPRENFADKWADHPRKAQVFLEWLDAVEREHQELLSDRGFRQVDRYLSDAYGEREASAAMSKYSGSQAAVAGAAPAIVVPRKSGTPATPTISVPPRPSKPWRP